MERHRDESPLCCPALHMLTNSQDERGVRKADVEQDKSFPGEHLFLLHCTIPSLLVLTDCLLRPQRQNKRQLSRRGEMREKGKEMIKGKADEDILTAK